MFHRTNRSKYLFVTALLLVSSFAAIAQNPQRSPSDTVRDFYRLLRERKFKEAFAISIYRPAIEGLSQQEFEELRPDFEKMAIAVVEKIPELVNRSAATRRQFL